jgi:Fe/S biogenesis protein NfuA
MEDAGKENLSEFSVTLTEVAKEKIQAALEAQSEKTALRVEARANGTPQFSYAMRLIAEEDKTDADLIVSGDGFDVVVDPASAKNLNGASIDYEDRVVRSGFKFDNPNKPEIPTVGSGPREDLQGSIQERVQSLLDTELNPAVAAHGGRMSLVGVRDNKVYLTFGGGCHGCGMVDMTLKHGVEARIRELIPEVEEVVDTTDHTAGENPFYS